MSATNSGFLAKLVLLISCFIGLGGFAQRGFTQRLPDPSSDFRKITIKVADLQNTNEINKATDCQEARGLVRQAEALRQEWRRDSLKAAISNYQLAIACFHQTGAPAEAAAALKGLGGVHIVLSQFTEAKDAYSQRLSLEKQLPDRGAEAEAAADLAVTLGLIGETTTALKVAQEALLLSQRLRDQAREAQALYALGICQYFMTDLDLSLKYQTKALSLAQGNEQQEVRAKILLGIAYVHNDLDDLEQALVYYNQSLTDWKALRNPWGEAKVLSSMGLTYILLGDRQRALESLRTTLANIQKIGDRQVEAATLNNIAYLYQTFGEPEVALQYYQEARHIYEEIGSKEGTILGYSYCGDVFAQSGQTEQAFKSYETAISLARSGRKRLMEADALIGVGALYFKQGERERARKIFETSLAKYKEEAHWRGQAAASNSLGFYFEVTDQKLKSLKYYGNALFFAESAQDQEVIAGALYNLSRVEIQLGHLDKAREYLERCLAINESSRAKVASPDLKGSYLASVHRHYESYIDVLMRLHEQRPNEGFDALALQASERARARSFLDSLGESRGNLRHGVDPALLGRERQLQRSINTKIQEKLLSSKGNLQELDVLNREINQLVMEYHGVLGEIRAKSPNYAALIKPEALDLKRVQLEVLSDDSILLEYALGEERSYLWAVTRTEISSYVLHGRYEIETSARKVYELITANLHVPGESFEDRESRLTNADRQLHVSIAELSNLILGPVASKLGKRTLLIVPDGALQYIPFQVLIIPTIQQNADVKGNGATSGDIRVITDHEIVNEPSASVLAALVEQSRNRKPAANAVAVLADPVFETDDPRLSNAKPSAEVRQSELHQALQDVSRSETAGRLPRLPASQDEAQAIMSVTPWRSGFQAVGFEANRETATRSDLANYRIVHFATHGLLNDKHPQLSGVVLSLFNEKGEPQDGFLRLHDIYNLNLPIDLVVLSACNTGLGKDVRGEGLIGLTRGFMYAGASSVVASLWKVDDDATAELMKLFYAGMLQEELSPAAALRKAQLTMSKQKRWQSPYYWSGFIIQGQYRQTQRPTFFITNKLKVLVSVAAIVLLSAFFIWKRRRPYLL